MENRERKILQGLLFQIEVLLGIENKKFEKAVDALSNEEISEEKLQKYFSIIFDTVYNEFNADEVIANSISQDEYLLTQRYENLISSKGTISGADLTCYLYIVKDIADKKIGKSYIDSIIASLKEFAENNNMSTALNVFKGINEKASLNEKKKTVVTALQEIALETKRNLIIANGKKVTPSIKPKLEKISNELANAIAALNQVEFNASDMYAQCSYDDIIAYVDYDTINKNVEALIKECNRCMHKYGNNEEPQKPNANAASAVKPDANIVKAKEKEERVTVKNNGYVLNRTEAKGKTNKPIKPAGKKWKRYVAGALVIVTIATGSYLLGKNSNKNAANNSDGQTITNIANDETNGNIGVENPDDLLDNENSDCNIEFTEEELNELAVSRAKSIYENWQLVGTSYTEENILELIKVLNGMDSTMTLDTADEMLVEMINNATVPVFNNIAYNGNESVSEILIADLLIKNQKGISAVQNMEDYLNKIISTNSSIYAVKALSSEVKMVLLNEADDDIKAEDISPEVKLVWSRLVIGTNALTGFLGDDFVFEVDGKEYTQSEINDWQIFEEMATSAKKEMGLTAKTLTLN
jgi:hypothetical protein